MASKITFATKAEADAAQAEIAKQMGLGLPGNVTVRWSDTIKNGSQWVLDVPEDRFMQKLSLTIKDVTMEEIVPLVFKTGAL